MLKTCPTPEQLRGLLAEQLGDPQDHSIGDHVEGCPLCQESLERLTDTAVRPGRRPPLLGPVRGRADVDTGFLNALKSNPPAGVILGEFLSVAGRSTHP